jgi:serine/threonine-protein kinase
MSRRERDDVETVRVTPPDAPPLTLRSAVERLVAGRGLIPDPKRFSDLGEIARGGMGSVRRLRDKLILRTVAKKQLHQAALGVPGAPLRFLEEAQITGQLDHPNIVPIYDVVVDESGVPAYFTMKLVRGKTLRTLADEAHAEGITGQHIESFFRIILRVCDALSFAHERGVIHRDLKPDNVMVGSHGQVYLMDWGIALLKATARPSDSVREHAEASEHTEPAVLGTPAYMAPEQAQGRVDAIDERTDVFGVGGILYRVLSGRAPWAGSGSGRDAIVRACTESVPPLDTTPGTALPPGACRIVDKALAQSPEDRYPSIAALASEIEAFLRGGGWFDTLRLRAGTVIVREGDPPDAAYVINSGHCDAYKLVSGKKQLLRRMGPGEAFGESSIFTNQPRTASVAAVDDVELTVITLSALDRELGRASWMRTFVKGLAERFLDADRELSRLRAEQAR